MDYHPDASGNEAEVPASNKNGKYPWANSQSVSRLRVRKIQGS